jgi:hypothetical protein
VCSPGSLRSLRVTITFIVIIIFFFFAFAVIFLFVFFILVWHLPQENIGIYPCRGLDGLLWLASVPIELRLEARLRILSSPESGHGNVEFSVAKCAGSNCWSGTQPFNDPETTLDHKQIFLF